MGRHFGMKIKLRTSPKGEWSEIEVESGKRLEDIYKSMKDELPYTVLAAKVNNQIQELGYALQESCNVEFLDMRTQAANLIYQHSLSLIYLKAVYDVLGYDEIGIMNSLNKGLYTQTLTDDEITEEDVRRIEERMHELVDGNFPFVREIVDRENAMKILERDGRMEKQRLLAASLNLSYVTFYSLQGYRNFFYGLMVPSTGYIKHFELMKYRKGILLRFPHPSNPNVIPDFVDEVKMYQAFSEQTRWDELLGVNYVSDLNEKIESGEYKELIQISEALHEKKIAQIADMIKTQKKRIILIAGPSSSGKTTFARRLCVQLRVNGLKPLYLGTDDFFLEREDTPKDEHCEYDFENLDALDIGLFNDCMNGLLRGETVDIPEFDFVTGHKVFGKRKIKISKNQPIVIEGIHGLNGTLTESIDDNEKFKIYISPLTQLNIDAHNRIPTTDERMLRRMVRDNLYRGRNAQSTIRDWPKVRAGEDRNIFPYSNEADVFFNSYHVYEISVLRKYAENLLLSITPMEEEYAEAVRLLKFLRFFRKIEDDSVIVNNSIIREFIGGSIFVD